MVEFEKEVINIGSSKGIIIPDYFVKKLDLRSGDIVEINIEKK